MFLARPILNAVAFYEPESYSAEQWFADHFAVRPAPDAQVMPNPRGAGSDASNGCGKAGI